MSDNDNKTVYILVGVGITLLAVIAIFSFLTNRKVERMSWQTINTTHQLNPLSYNTPLNTLDNNIQTTDVPISKYIPPVFDEKIYRLLEIQQRQLEDVNANVNSLKSLNYRIPSFGVNNNMSKAGSVTSIRTGAEDKTRQKEFGMI